MSAPLGPPDLVVVSLWPRPRDGEHGFWPWMRVFVRCATTCLAIPILTMGTLVVTVSGLALVPLIIGIPLFPLLASFLWWLCDVVHTLITWCGVRMPASRPVPPPAWTVSDVEAYLRNKSMWLSCAGGLAIQAWAITIGGLVALFPSAAFITSSATVYGLFSPESYGDGIVLGTTVLSGPLLGVLLTVVFAAISAALAPACVASYALIYRRLCLPRSITTVDIYGRVSLLERERHEQMTEEARRLRALERNIHDGPQQLLVRAGMDLAAAQRRLGEDDTEAATRIIGEAKTHIEHALSDMRALVRGLAPPVLSELGLVEALATLAADAAVPTVVHSTLPRTARLDPTVEMALYFVASEAVANAVKHAGASRILITFDASDQGLHLRVSDDGHGGARLLPGHGLEGLNLRARMIDARLTLDSSSQGTTVSLVWAPKVEA